MSDANLENAIEFLTGEKIATLSLTSRKHISKLRKIRDGDDERGSDITFWHENNDGSVVCRVPLNWIKISPPRVVSDEQREAASNRFKEMWSNKE